MFQRLHIGQRSTKYPRESAQPTEAEEEGLQGLVNHHMHCNRAAQRGWPQTTAKGRGEGRGGEGGAESRRQDRRVPFHRSRSWRKPSQACLCKSRQVMMQVRLSDSTWVTHEDRGGTRICRHMAMALGTMMLTHTGADCCRALWLPSRHHLVHLFSWQEVTHSTHQIGGSQAYHYGCQGQGSQGTTPISSQPSFAIACCYTVLCPLHRLPLLYQITHSLIFITFTHFMA